MPDIIVFASNRTTFRNGTILTSTNKLGSSHTIIPDIEHNTIISESGILDTRLDSYCYYVTNPYSRIQ